MNIALGTAQFGFSYGIANTNGKVTNEMAKKILSRAKEANINTLDTAISYGESEQCLGNAGVGGWNLITKLPPIPENCLDVTDWVNCQINASLQRLKAESIMAIMLHRPKQLLESNGRCLWAALQALKNKGIIEKIGFSIYDVEELDLLLGEFKADIVQAPYNLLDQRLKKSGWLEKLHQDGVEVHVRSIFLQGLLLMNDKYRIKKFSRWSLLWKKWERWLRDSNLSPLEACIGFVNSEPLIDIVVIGVDSLQQLEQIIKTLALNKNIDQIPQEIVTIDQDLINPSNWKNL
jgi:aryl-alcohol dehydrogenase-like predicted oxidoreductase